MSIAESLDIHVKYDTARKIIKSGLVTMKKHGGRRHNKVDQEVKDYLEQMISINPTTLQQMQEGLRSEMPQKLALSLSTFSPTLDGMLYTVNKVRNLPADRNKSNVINAKKGYATWFLDKANEHRCVYVDETNFNLWTFRSQRRSKCRMQCFRTVAGQRGH